MQILTYRLAAGTQISSVRDLALQLKINPMTVSRAYFQLEQEGLLERRQGIGLFVAELPQARRNEASLHVLEEALRTAAVTAIQLHVPKELVMEMFQGIHAQMDEGQGGEHGTARTGGEDDEPLQELPQNQGPGSGESPD